QVQDLLGEDTALLLPMRDLLQRPTFRALFRGDGRSVQQGRRDALLSELALTYASGLLARLSAVMDGCLGFPPGSPRPPSSVAAPWRQPPAPVPPSASPPGPTRSWMPGSVAAPASVATHPITLITLLFVSLLVGGVAAVLGWIVLTRAGGFGGVQSPGGSPVPSSAGWQACLREENRDGAPPQPGETWWPVVGPPDALEAARQHCRADAFVNRSGNVQIASFRSLEIASRFVEQLNQDGSIPYRFRVGEASLR
ncbi:MAG: hypothetical protein ACKO0M_05195, partial [Cyanobium sp.]